MLDVTCPKVREEIEALNNLYLTVRDWYVMQKRLSRAEAKALDALSTEDAVQRAAQMLNDRHLLHESTQHLVSQWPGDIGNVDDFLICL